MKKLSIRTRLLLLVPALLVLGATALYLLRWPTLGPEGALRRLERAALFPRGEVVAQGDFAYQDDNDPTPTGNYFMVSRSGDRYAVAVLERFWGVLYRPARRQIEFYVSGWRTWAGDTLELFSVGGSTVPVGLDMGYENVHLVLSHDPAIVRVEVTQASVPRANWSDPVSYLTEHGVAADCVQVAPEVWLGQLTAQPMASPGSSPWTILRGYDATGRLVYEKLPDPR